MIGRLLLERGLSTRETLQQAAGATLQRRQQTGQEVELLMVLVEMGALDRGSASQIWQEASRLPAQPTPPPQPAVSPPHPGFTPPRGLGAVPPVNDGFSASAPTMVGNFDVQGARAAMDADEMPTIQDGPIPGLGPPPGGYGPPPGTGAFPPPSGSFAPPGTGTFPPPSGSFAPPGTGTFPPPSGGFGPPPGSANFPPTPAAPTGFGSEDPTIGPGGMQVPAGGWDQPGGAGFDSQAAGGFKAAPVDVFNPKSGDSYGRPPSWDTGEPPAGAPLPAPAPAAPSGSSKLKKKGPRLSSNRTSLSQRRAAQSQGGSKLPIIIGVALLLLVGVGVGVFVYLGSDDGKKPKKPPRDGAVDAGSEDGGEDPPKRPDDPKPANQDPGDGIEIPKRPSGKISREDLEATAEAVGDKLLSVASDLAHESERYDDAVRTLEKYPDWLREASIAKEIEKKLAEYSTFAGFNRQLEEALVKGKGSDELRRMILKVEGGGLSEDLRSLPCLERFKTDARGLLGDSGYDKLALEAAKLDELEDQDGPGLEDN